MKSEIHKKQKNEYPKLMIHEHYGYVVLFHAYAQGISLQRCDADNVIEGQYSDQWLLAPFKDFKGQIILEND